jgi:hypothetical protein
MIARCAHNARTNGPQQTGRTCQQAACSQRPELHEREIPARSVTVWYAINGAANAVRVRALPGFKSPSLRPLTRASSEITDPVGSPGSAFLGLCP